MDSGFRVASLHFAGEPAGSHEATNTARHVAWFAAGRGDRTGALSALQQGAADPVIRKRPGSLWDASQTCFSAEVYGLLGDAEAMLPLLQRCLAMPNGYHLVQLGAPAFARFRTDPRVRALASELAADQARTRSAPDRAQP